MSDVNDNRGGDPIRAEEWQAAGGVGIPLTEEGICDCGEPYHDHDKERVSHGNGTYSYEYVCPGGSA